MSKMIRLTPDSFNEICKEFKSNLQKAKITDGRFSFTKTFEYTNRKATIYFSEIAWRKMQALIREFSTEVGWHGVAYRGDDVAKDEYYITDILVYPQQVTGATVNTDQNEYEMWLMGHDDGVFNNIRMHGHSHVRMGTSPSPTDTTHWGKIIEQLEDDMFYIFMIWNKQGESTIRIYDYAKNILFDGTDVSVEVKYDNTNMSEFITFAKDTVKDKKFTSVGSACKNIGLDYCYDAYSNITNTVYYNESKLNNKTDVSSTRSSGKKRKGKRKGRKPTDNTISQTQITLFDDDII